jgi:putative IMPACT (imprinted ancient) family translation regulator
MNNLIDVWFTEEQLKTIQFILKKNYTMDMEYHEMKELNEIIEHIDHILLHRYGK